jgi:hypothetical protein
MPQATKQQRPYAWSRFWIPVGGSLDLSDAGFLSDPSNSHGPDRPATLVAVEQHGPPVEPGTGDCPGPPVDDALREV